MLDDLFHLVVNGFHGVHGKVCPLASAGLKAHVRGEPLDTVLASHDPRFLRHMTPSILVGRRTVCRPTSSHIPLLYSSSPICETELASLRNGYNDSACDYLNAEPLISAHCGFWRRGVFECDRGFMRTRRPGGPNGQEAKLGGNHCERRRIGGCAARC